MASLRARGVAPGRIGVVGLTSRAVLQSDGWLPYTGWKTVVEALPRTRVNIGGTVVITDDGHEELNSLLTNLVVVEP